MFCVETKTFVFIIFTRKRYKVSKVVQKDDQFYRFKVSSGFYKFYSSVVSGISPEFNVSDFGEKDFSVKIWKNTKIKRNNVWIILPTDHKDNSN